MRHALYIHRIYGLQTQQTYRFTKACCMSSKKKKSKGQYKPDKTGHVIKIKKKIQY